VEHTKGLLHDYASERKEAAAAWAGVSRGGAEEAHAAKPAAKKKEKKETLPEE
jgi:hypothetical protein